MTGCVVDHVHEVGLAHMQDFFSKDCWAHHPKPYQVAGFPNMYNTLAVDRTCQRSYASDLHANDSLSWDSVCTYVRWHIDAGVHDMARGRG
jgi:hypothetical protein